MPKFDTPQPITVTVEISAGSVRLVATDRDDTVVEVTEGVVNGTAVEMSTGLEQWQLGNASTRVFSK